jgi:hypothetical protein
LLVGAGAALTPGSLVSLVVNMRVLNGLRLGQQALEIVCGAQESRLVEAECAGAEQIEPVEDGERRANVICGEVAHRLRDARQHVRPAFRERAGGEQRLLDDEDPAAANGKARPSRVPPQMG